VTRSFENEVAVVTGAASGIGLALCRELAQRGARVVLADIVESELEAAARELSKSGTEVLPVVTDVSSRESVGELADRALERFSRVDLLFNNAGVSTCNRLRDQSLSDWEWVLKVNLWGVIHGLDVFLPIFRRQGGAAHIVNTGSIAGVLSGAACLGPYAVSKVGVVSISETLRAELAQEESPIQVSVLCPAATNTGIMDSDRLLPPDEREQRSEVGEQFRLAVKGMFTEASGLEPEEVARMTLEGVAAGRFWIFTHAALRPILEARVAEILEAHPRP
jgi:NAD(P)-dependent dehydrogenase (short-subunit alcohol dehydrogenase family)